MPHYMKKKPISVSYTEVKKSGSLEHAVDGFWNLVLHEYFTSSLDFGIVPQRRPNDAVGLRADLTIRHVRGDPAKFSTVMVFENKRREFEGRDGEWRQAFTQLTAYLLSVAKKQAPMTLYGAVAIGRYVRFYAMEAGDTLPRDLFPNTDSQPYEVKDHEEEIHKILEWLVTESQTS
ncbi:hypothetical protein N7456_001808 [Penicillium angulare]|uniref:Uncharacterized protein n=1 Tax=Penicillium angulare TaxID=116970 RepID=A0A9W9G6W5_9EURO|nr:hypothetical protein N7456_001808 [Penicillium angulare]